MCRTLYSPPDNAHWDCTAPSWTGPRYRPRLTRWFVFLLWLSFPKSSIPSKQYSACQNSNGMACCQIWSSEIEHSERAWRECGSERSCWTVIRPLGISAEPPQIPPTSRKRLVWIQLNWSSLLAFPFLFLQKGKEEEEKEKKGEIWF